MLEQVLIKVSAIEKTIEMQPQIDAEKFKAIDVALITCKGSCNARIEKVEQDVEEIKSKPSKRWDSAVNGGIGTLVGGIITYVLLNVLK